MRKYYVVFDVVVLEDSGPGGNVYQAGNARGVFETDEPMSFEQIRTLEAQQAEENGYFDCKMIAYFPLENEGY